MQKVLWYLLSWKWCNGYTKNPFLGKFELILQKVLEYHPSLKLHYGCSKTNVFGICEKKFQKVQIGITFHKNYNTEAIKHYFLLYYRKRWKKCLVLSLIKLFQEKQLNVIFKNGITNLKNCITNVPKHYLQLYVHKRCKKRYGTSYHENWPMNAHKSHIWIYVKRSWKYFFDTIYCETFTTDTTKPLFWRNMHKNYKKCFSTTVRTYSKSTMVA